MTKAIQIWEKELTEADYKNENARVNHKVASIISYNLLLANFWLSRFEELEKYFKEPELNAWDFEIKTDKGSIDFKKDMNNAISFVKNSQKNISRHPLTY